MLRLLILIQCFSYQRYCTEKSQSYFRDVILKLCNGFKWISAKLMRLHFKLKHSSSTIYCRLLNLAALRIICDFWNFCIQFKLAWCIGLALNETVYFINSIYDTHSEPLGIETTNDRSERNEIQRRIKWKQNIIDWRLFKVESIRCDFVSLSIKKF